MDEPRRLAVMPPEIVVADEEEPCPYIEGRIARRPLRLPTRRLRPSELDARLEAGDRRAGLLFYTQTCPDCRACEPLRIDTSCFVASRSQRRALARASRVVRVEVGPLLLDEARVALFDRHQSLRGLRRAEQPFTAAQYHAFLVERAVESFEIRYFLEGRLVGVAITDRGAQAWSAVYTYYEPALAPPHRSLSLGTFSILTQIELARRNSVKWLYLGLAIEANPHMRYKLAFLPHERLIDGVWRRFPERADAPST